MDTDCDSYARLWQALRDVSAALANGLDAPADLPSPEELPSPWGDVDAGGPGPPRPATISKYAEKIDCSATSSPFSLVGVSIFGNGGGDWLLGGFDNDYLDGGQGADRLDGNDGDDILYAVDGHTWDRISGGKGYDVAKIDPPREILAQDTATGMFDVESVVLVYQ